MKQDTKWILKVIFLFGGIFAVVSIITSLILQELNAGKSQKELIASITLNTLLWDAIRIGILVWALIYLSRKLRELRYRKLAFAGLGLIIVSYHLYYLYEAIDYYIIHKPPMQTQSRRIQEVLGLIVNTRTAPVYAPIDHLTGWQMIYGGPFGELSFGRVFFVLLYGPLTLPLWLSGIVYLLFRKRSQKTQ